MASKRSMPSNSNQPAKRRKDGGKTAWKPPSKKLNVESGDWGVFVTCDIGREAKCLHETVDIFSQSLESSTEIKEEEDEDEDDGDIEAQIQRELEGLKPSKEKRRPFETLQFDMPCVTFVRLDKSIDPVPLVHRLCTEARAHPEQKKSRYIKRMTPVSEIKKTLSVDLAAFAKDILKPHFHSGGPPKKYAIRPTVRGNEKFNRDIVIKTVADAVGPEHTVDLKNYDLIILVDVVQKLIGMSVVGSDYDQLKRFNLAEIYNPSEGPTASKKGKPKEEKS
ncbi:hypothetical protein N7492_008426 [Penicillium capsulatum]|uniref:THUMP domain-containing protein n=1 Tax=Penicillium capsulatum TaxID=69766 RepID=A0A9W9LGX5_9EURO|nr:hypothetical protein N7492_008426 [Penicillium capsulatum]KAJ6105828.1 hypothetical protein N7512_009345 [Penicillium capsulatum]